MKRADVIIRASISCIFSVFVAVGEVMGQCRRPLLAKADKQKGNGSRDGWQCGIDIIRRGLGDIW